MSAKQYNACPPGRTPTASARVRRLIQRWLPLLLLLSACKGGSGAEGSAAGNAALADTLKRMISDAYDFSKPGVVERMTALYAPVGNIVSASGGGIVASRDSITSGIARFWENVGRNMKNPEWKWGDVFVERLGSDAATFTASWTIPHTAPDGQPHTIGGAWTAVFKRTPQGWRIVQEHLSSR